MAWFQPFSLRFVSKDHLWILVSRCAANGFRFTWPLAADGDPVGTPWRLAERSQTERLKVRISKLNQAVVDKAITNRLCRSIGKHPCSIGMVAWQSKTHPCYRWWIWIILGMARHAEYAHTSDENRIGLGPLGPLGPWALGWSLGAFPTFPHMFRPTHDFRTSNLDAQGSLRRWVQQCSPSHRRGWLTVPYKKGMSCPFLAMDQKKTS